MKDVVFAKYDMQTKWQADGCSEAHCTEQITGSERCKNLTLTLKAIADCLHPEFIWHMILQPHD